MIIPESRSSEIRFGIAISPFRVSEISHISVPLPTAPTMQNRTKMIL